MFPMCCLVVQVLLEAHDSSSFFPSSQGITNLLLKTINDTVPSNVIQVIKDNAANCEGAGKPLNRYILTFFVLVVCCTH
jgi:hypothetical protein